MLMQHSEFILLRSSTAHKHCCRRPLDGVPRDGSDRAAAKHLGEALGWGSASLLLLDRLGARDRGSLAVSGELNRREGRLSRCLGDGARWG